MTFMNPDVQVLEYGNSVVKCDATISHVITALLRDIPTANEVT